MATLLLLDGDDVAARALRGILAHGNHPCLAVDEPGKAWRALREGVAFDLVVLDLDLAGGGGLEFVQRLRTDWFWEELPVLVYTGDNDPARVKQALGLNVQNFLLKPYDEARVHAEIAKALANPWRRGFFAEAKVFCAENGISGEVLAQRRRQLMQDFEHAAREFPKWEAERQNREVFARLEALGEAARAAGVHAGRDFLRHLREQALEDRWTAFGAAGDVLEFARRLTFCQLNPSHAPDCSGGREVTDAQWEANERQRWKHSDVVAGGPVVAPEELMKAVDSLAGSPVVASMAAAFKMLVGGRASGMAQMMDLVAGDPGLAAQVLAAANRGRAEDEEEFDDPATAAARIGETKLRALAATIPVVADERFDVSPLTWSGFWMFQVAVGRVAQFVCAYLEFDYLKGVAMTAGLLHDLGRPVLLRLHPYALAPILQHAREHRIPVAEAERRYLGCTTRDLAIRLAERQHLPAACRSVVRWVDAPALATRDLDLVAIVAVARQICLHAHVGCSVDAPAPGRVAEVAATPAWSVLQARLFPSFDLRKFEVQAHAFCLNVRNDLTGRVGSGRPSHAQRAAELV